jgi:isopentenyl-diphosphate delta-isomerase
LIYRAAVSDGLIEHEYVHLFAGRWRGKIRPNADEAEAHAWHPLHEVQAAAADHPERFTVWFRIYLEEAATALA